MTEAFVAINGKELSIAEVMTLRVAVSVYLMEMRVPNALGSDETGKAIQNGYSECCKSILRKMHE